MPDLKVNFLILLVEDNLGDAILVQELVSEVDHFGIELHHESSLAAALGRLDSFDPDVILLDLGLPDAVGLSALRAMKEACADCPIVVLTSNRDPETSIQALDLGAQDYLNKDNINSQSLGLAIRYAWERQAHMRDLLNQAHETYALKLQIEGERFLREMVSGVHHEFRTPLTVIQSGVSLIKHKQGDAWIDKKVGEIQEAIRYLEGITDYMAAIATLSANPVESVAPLSFVEIEFLVESLSSTHERIGYRIDLDPDCFVRVPKDALKTILKILVHNALDYSEAGSPVEIVVQKSDKVVDFGVTDRGIGISQAEFENIFLPFYKIDQSRRKTQRSDGGLGLSLAQATAFAYGGRISVESEVEVGSTFCLSLPKMVNPNWKPPTSKS